MVFFMKKSLKKQQIRQLMENFKQKLGYECNLKDPKTIQEKIQWIKIYGKLERFARFTDKYEVRKFIRKKIGKEYLIPHLGVYDHIDKIDFDRLPHSFVLKATHGSSWFMIVEDKEQIDWQETKRIMDSWLQSSWFSKSKESNHKPLKKRIIIQQYLPRMFKQFAEYSFHCFHGVPQFVRVDGFRSFGIYSMNWDPIMETFDPHHGGGPIEKPDTFDRMVVIAKTLSKDLPYVRVDLFDAGGRIYFNELTFTPGGGYLQTSSDFGLWVGSLLDLKKYV